MTRVIVATLRRRRDLAGDFIIRDAKSRDCDYFTDDWDDAWNTFVYLADHVHGDICEIVPRKKWIIFKCY